jgi:hypothetical protein
VVSYKFVWLLLYALVNGGILALVSWYYAWLAASSSPKPRSSANSRLQQ